MSEVRCDECKKHEDVWIGAKDVYVIAQKPSCNFEVVTKIDQSENECLVNIVYSAIIKDGEQEALRFEAPYTLTYTIEKYKKYGENEILTSALHETEVDGYLRCLLLVDIYAHTIVLASGKPLN